MFGGIQGICAAEAWYATSLDLEWAIVSRTPMIGGALDVFKFFDQIIRGLLYCVLFIAGLSRGILIAYIRLQESTLIYNSIAGTLGAPHRRKCGIPQGCPLSMIYISLYLRAWVIQMRSFGAMPRTLADDLMLLVTGNQDLHIFRCACTAMLEHLTALGGKLSAHKSRLFSTIEIHRKWLAAYVWPVAQQ